MTASYTPNLDFTFDDLVWDNVQTIDHTSVRITGDVTTEIDRAHRHYIGRKELAASNGVYTPDDVIWRFPDRYVTNKPKPRDRILDADGVTWTILEAWYIFDQKRHRCACRNLILAFDLYDQIDVETPAITYDAAGVATKTWGTLYSQIPSRLQPITADIADERGIRALRVTHNLIVDRVLSVTNEDRVLLNGTYYEIRGYHNPERIDELLVLDVEIVP